MFTATLPMSRLIKSERRSDNGTNQKDGCMRLPMKDGEVDHKEFSKMVDEFLRNGFNYFDTAHGYLGGKSETALKACLTSRYPRDRYILTNKLTNFFFKKQEDIRPFFESQLKACGVEYFDLYYQHRIDPDVSPEEVAGTMAELIQEGKIRAWGISETNEEYLRRAHAVCPVSAIQTAIP